MGAIAPTRNIRTADAVSEADKPFFLLLILITLLGAVVVLALYFGQWAQVQNLIGVLTGMISLGVGMYFHAKTTMARA